MTQFALKINEDIINFINIPVNENGLPENSHEVELFQVLNSDPSVIDISNLVYNPYLDSEWNGKDFVDSENREQILIPSNLLQDKRFAFVVNNKYKLFYGAKDTEANEMLIAALSSNPQIVVRTNS